jgi:hypothetical protein
MGNRVSIQFKMGTEKSVVLFDHWGGMERVEHAKAYADKLVHEELRVGPGSHNSGDPLGRFEPNTVMLDYLAQLGKNEYQDEPGKDVTRVRSSLYLGKSSRDGDNCDNGHHVIDLEKYTKDILV